MKDNLIYGINPLIISKIVRCKGHRIGLHPCKRVYLQMKNPIRSALGFYEPLLFDGYIEPTVDIYGSDGDLLKVIPCRSNDHAKRLKEELDEKLNSFLSSLKVNE